MSYLPVWLFETTVLTRVFPGYQNASMRHLKHPLSLCHWFTVTTPDFHHYSCTTRTARVEWSTWAARQQGLMGI